MTALLLSFIFSVMPGHAAPIKEEPKSESLDKVLIKKDIELHNKLDGVAKSVDEALAGEKTTDIENKTKLTIRNQLNYAEGGAFSYTPHFDLKLHLPNLEKKWQLKFTTYDEDQENRGVNRNRLKTAPYRENYGGGVGILQKLGQVNAEFQPRIEFHGKVELSYILKLTSEAKTKQISIYPEMQFFARSDEGVGQFIGLNSDIPLFTSFVFTLINEEQYVDRNNVFSTNNGVRLGWDYSEKVAENIQILFESSQRPNYHLDRYTVATAVTHKLWKNVLHYTLMPYLAFPRYLDFKGSPGINAEINFIF